MTDLVNVYVVRVSEEENARLFGVVQRSRVLVSLSPELVKSVVELSGGKVAPILSYERVGDGVVQCIIWRFDEHYDDAVRALIDAINDAVLRKLGQETEFKVERTMTLNKEDVRLMDYILQLEKSAKEAKLRKIQEEFKMRMKEVCKARGLEFIDGYDKFIVVLQAHNRRREITFEYNEDGLQKLQTFDIQKQMIELLNEVIMSLKKENEELQKKLVDSQGDEAVVV